jgi:DNA mismatch repair ATPase MutS
MAISDNLLAEESYFISEIKSIKRILDADTLGQPILCLIDEILRGTNTIERIAASSELLVYIAKRGMLCIAATHDIELCSMLGDYDMKHFEETIEAGGNISFDYKIKKGPATSRNAIKLLDSMGFGKELVNRANDKANRYTNNGKWV